MGYGAARSAPFHDLSMAFPPRPVMPTLAKPLTKRQIDATPADPTRDFVLWDGGDGAIKGFGIRLRPSGRRTFIFQYDVAGRARRVTLGDFGVLTVEQARDAARTCAADAKAAK